MVSPIPVSGDHWEKSALCNLVASHMIVDRDVRIHVFCRTHQDAKDICKEVQQLIMSNEHYDRIKEYCRFLSDRIVIEMPDGGRKELRTYPSNTGSARGFVAKTQMNSPIPVKDRVCEICGATPESCSSKIGVIHVRDEDAYMYCCIAFWAAVRTMTLERKRLLWSGMYKGTTRAIIEAVNRERGGQCVLDSGNAEEVRADRAYDRSMSNRTGIE